MPTWRKRPRKPKWIVALKRGVYEENSELRTQAIRAANNGELQRAAALFEKLEQFCRQVGDVVGCNSYRNLKNECTKRFDQNRGPDSDSGGGALCESDAEEETGNLDDQQDT
jgi:hypothetical protein